MTEDKARPFEDGRARHYEHERMRRPSEEHEGPLEDEKAAP